MSTLPRRRLSTMWYRGVHHLIGAVRRFNVAGAVTVLALLAAWQLLISLKIVVAQTIVSPWQIMVALYDIAASGALWTDLEHTLRGVLVGWLFAALGGTAVGVVVGYSSRLWTLSMASIDFLRSLPAIAFIPTAVLIFGFSTQTEVVVSAYAGFWLVLVNTAVGIRDVPAGLLESAQTLRLDAWKTVRSVLVPAAVPSVIVGLRLAMSVCLVVTIIAEMVGNPAGLGYAIVFAQQGLRPADMFANIVVIGLLGVLLNAAIQLASLRLPAVAVEAMTHAGAR